MNSKKPIDVGMSSALIDLKAELLRKQGELELSRSSKHGVTKSSKRSDILKAKCHYSKTNKGIDSRSEKDLQLMAEEEKKQLNARSILEAKAKLYDKMRSEALDHDEHDHPVLSQSLVNFTQKAIDDLRESRDKLESRMKNRLDQEGQDDETVSSEFDYTVNEEEWTEFTDSYGRTRRCLKSDLPSFMSRNEQVGQRKSTEEDALLEMKRKRWEEEAEEAAAKEKVHYQDVLYDEVRSHGAAYYGFSKDQQAREEQLRELKKISEQTTAAREKVGKEKDDKKSQLKDRLKKIRAKKRAKLGLEPEDDLDDDDNQGQQDESKKAKIDLDPSSLLIVEESEKPLGTSGEGVAEMRPWDFGKTGVFGPRPTNFDELDEKWLRNRRTDRLEEFAPPSLYSVGSSTGSRGSLGSRNPTSVKKAFSSTTTTTTSTGSSSDKGEKYSNFVKSKECIGSIGINLEPQVLGSFKPPEQFWKDGKAPADFSASSSSAAAKSTVVGSKTWGINNTRSANNQPWYRQQRATASAAAGIVDESAAPVAETGDEFQQGRGTNIPPPPTLDYYHGPAGFRTTRPPKPATQSDELVFDAVSSGLKALREKFEADQQQAKSKSVPEEENTWRDKKD